MSNEETKLTVSQFLKPFGKKITSGEHYFEDDDTTDQRAPVNNIDELYNQFVVPMDVMDELEDEKVEDFDDDIYDYDDRSELGEDVAAAGQIDMEKYIAEKQSQQKQKSAEADDGAIEKPAD